MPGVRKSPRKNRVLGACELQDNWKRVSHKLSWVAPYEPQMTDDNEFRPLTHAEYKVPVMPGGVRLIVFDDYEGCRVTLRIGQHGKPVTLRVLSNALIRRWNADVTRAEIESTDWIRSGDPFFTLMGNHVYIEGLRPQGRDYVLDYGS